MTSGVTIGHWGLSPVAASDQRREIIHEAVDGHQRPLCFIMVLLGRLPAAKWRLELSNER